MVLFALLFSVADLLIPYVYVKGLDGLGVKYELGLEPVDVVMVGASHMSWGMDPDVFADKGIKAANYARVGQHVDFYNDFYTSYRNQFDPPEVVILSMPIFIFNETDMVTTIYLLEGRDLTRFYFSWENMRRVKLYAYRQLFQKAPGFFLHLLRGRKEVIHGYMGHLRPELVDVNLSKTEVYTRTTDRVEDYQGSKYEIDALHNSKSLSDLHDVLSLMEKDGVAVYLVETPEYIGTKETYVNRDKFYEDMAALVSGYSNVVFVSQEEIPEIDPEDRSLFYDGGWGMINSHLSIKGSKIYTQVIMDRILDEVDLICD